jgi:hypothetical protein
MTAIPVTAVSHSVHQPAGALRRYVREILWVRSEHPRVQILLPETTLTLALRQSGSALLRNQALPTSVVSGLQEHARAVQHTPGSSVVIVRFTEVGAPAILHDRADLLYNRTLPLDSVLPRQEIETVQNILADFRSLPQQVLSMERFLAGRLRLPDQVSPQNTPNLSSSRTLVHYLAWLFS